MDTIGKRIATLRKLKGWSRPELGRQMAAAVGKDRPFTGELVRLYETGANNPGNEARRALSLVFGKTETFIEFGEGDGPKTLRKAIRDEAALNPYALLDQAFAALVIVGHQRQEILAKIRAAAEDGEKIRIAVLAQARNFKR